MPPPYPLHGSGSLGCWRWCRTRWLQDRFKINQKIHHIFKSMFDACWDPFWRHVGSIFVPFLVSDRFWTLIFIKHVDFHEKL